MTSLPPALLRDEAWPRLWERALLPAWHWLGEGTLAPGEARPLALLPGPAEVPLVALRDEDGRTRVFSNVCTHRANRLVREPCSPKVLRCGYHGRRFDRAGRCLGSPGFEGEPGFPAPEDHLPEADAFTLGPMLFARAGQGQAPPPVEALFAGLPLGAAVHDPTGDRVFEIDAHWVLWVENYLEGLHIPFVHPALARSLDLGAYQTRLTPWGSVQRGVAAPGERALPLAPTHPDAAQPLAGLYLWIFPGICLNLYPWGVSLNAVQPLGPARTRIVYRRYVWDATALGAGAGGDLDTVEREDDAVVEEVQRCVRSPLFGGARPSPGAEPGVLHFHRMLRATTGL